MEFFKIRNKPLAALVANHVNQTQVSLEYDANDPLISSEIIAKCNYNGVDPNEFKPHFCEEYAEFLTILFENYGTN